jgi:hypothetical protein
MDIEAHEKRTAGDLMYDDQNLNEYLTLIREQDNDSLIDILGLQKTGKGYRFDFFNRPILFDQHDFIDLSGEELSLSIKIVFCRYMLNSPQPPLEKSVKLVTFREFSGAGPLFYRFAENTSKTVEQTFSKRVNTLEEKCRQLYGIPVSNASYDLSMRLKALPRIPITLLFNDVDDILPAKAVFLFHEDAVNHLDLKSIGVITTYLTGHLITGL